MVGLNDLKGLSNLDHSMILHWRITQPFEYFWLRLDFMPLADLFGIVKPLRISENSRCIPCFSSFLEQVLWTSIGSVTTIQKSVNSL